MARRTSDQSIWDAAVEETKRILIQCAIARTTLCYSDFVERLTVVHLPPRGRELSGLLEDVCRIEHEAGRGLLTALMVPKGGGIPGRGFFDLAKRLGYEVKDRHVFWAEQLLRILDVWADR